MYDVIRETSCSDDKGQTAEEQFIVKRYKNVNSILFLNARRQQYVLSVKYGEYFYIAARVQRCLNCKTAFSTYFREEEEK